MAYSAAISLAPSRCALDCRGAVFSASRSACATFSNNSPLSAHSRMDFYSLTAACMMTLLLAAAPPKVAVAVAAAGAPVPVKVMVPTTV